MTKKNNWNLQEMQETLVKDTEQRISDGFQEIAEEQGGEKHHPSDIIPQTSGPESQTVPQNPVNDAKHLGDIKGVQTHITMEDYRRLMEVKLRRDAAVIQQPRTTIAKLAAEAIGLWLDVQEGKISCSFLPPK